MADLGYNYWYLGDGWESKWLGYREFREALLRGDPQAWADFRENAGDLKLELRNELLRIVYSEAHRAMQQRTTTRLWTVLAFVALFTIGVTVGVFFVY